MQGISKLTVFASLVLACITSAAAALDDDDCAYPDFDLGSLLRAVRAMF